MKYWSVMLTVLLCFGIFAGYGEKTSHDFRENENVQADSDSLDKEEVLFTQLFSYEKDLSECEQNVPWVRHGGFQNTSEWEIATAEDAVARAELECTIEHQNTKAWYDDAADMWKVLLYTEGTLGNCQTVYVDGKGLTRLIVYGE